MSDRATVGISSSIQPKDKFRTVTINSKINKAMEEKYDITEVGSSS